MKTKIVTFQRHHYRPMNTPEPQHGLQYEDLEEDPPERFPKVTRETLDKAAARMRRYSPEDRDRILDGLEPLNPLPEDTESGH